MSPKTEVEFLKTLVRRIKMLILKVVDIIVLCVVIMLGHSLQQYSNYKITNFQFITDTLQTMRAVQYLSI